MTTRVRVLLAEDDEDHAFLTVRALRDDGNGVTLEIEAVRDGIEALDYVHRRGGFADRERPDLILLDLKMPRCDGFEVLQVLKGDPEFREIPVIVLTSSDRDDDVRHAYRLGTNSYVVKPFDDPNVAERLREIPRYWTEVNTLSPRT